MEFIEKIKEIEQEKNRLIDELTKANDFINQVTQKIIYLTGQIDLLNKLSEPIEEKSEQEKVDDSNSQ